MPTGARPSFASRLRAPNPGPMTLNGTNTWLLRGSRSAASVVVDPGPDDVGHIEAIIAAGPIEAVLITHHHADHVGGLDRLTSKIDVPVRAADPAWCRGAGPLRDGEVLALAGLRIEVLTTPGHTGDSICLLASSEEAGSAVAQDAGVHADVGPRAAAAFTGAEPMVAAFTGAEPMVAAFTGAEPMVAVLTGDTILGRGTTIVAWPDGDLGDYLSSLARLGTLAGVPVLPGHGPDVEDCAVIASAYLAHREQRLDQVRAALTAGARTPADVVAAVYPDLEPPLVPAADQTVRAALAYLDVT